MPLQFRKGLGILVLTNVCLVPIFLGWIFVQGHFLDLHLMAAPWQHDDFAVLKGYDGFNFWFPRPISMNFARGLGSWGETVTYATYIFLWLVALALTHVLVVLVLDLRLPASAHAIFALVGSIIWHSQVSSVFSLQWISLITNMASYLPGVCAALSLWKISSSPRIAASSYTACLLGFGMLTMLSAFSKEDMGVFLCVTAVWTAWARYRGSGSLTLAVRYFAVIIAIIGTCYSLSILHSISVHSPFVNGPGAYDLSNAVNNIFTNLSFYVTVSPAAKLQYIFFAVLTVVVGIKAIVTPSWRTILFSVLYLFIASFALMAPYLALPRKFDFYSMNFVPILAFGFAPSVLVVARRALGSELVARAVAAGLAVATAALFCLIDTFPRENTLMWMASVRERSMRQIQEVMRAGDLGLRKCPSVQVSGVSDGAGPFFSPYGGDLNRRLGANIRWTIEVEPGSVLEGFSRSVAFSSGWVYRAAGGQRQGCQLNFDPETLRATFEP